MSHFYVNPKNIQNNLFVMDKQQLHYIVNVRRFAVDDEINLFDGLGNSFTGKITEISNNQLKGIIISKTSFIKPSVEVYLYCAIAKGERAEWLIEKAAEIGITKFIPLITKRSVITSLSENKYERFNKISLSASCQCGRADIMKIEKPVIFEEALKNNTDKNTISILAWESEDKKTIDDIYNSNKNIKKINIFIGPEGGFEPAEIELAKANNLLTATLGKNILRIETAALTASVLVLNKWI